MYTLLKLSLSINLLQNTIHISAEKMQSMLVWVMCFCIYNKADLNFKCRITKVLKLIFNKINCEYFHNYNTVTPWSGSSRWSDVSWFDEIYSSKPLYWNIKSYDDNLIVFLFTLFQIKNIVNNFPYSKFSFKYDKSKNESQLFYEF